MEKTDYKDLKVGDRVVIFSYWNSSPEASGTIVALTEHFAEVETRPRTFFFSRITQWFSRADKIEKVLWCGGNIPQYKKTR